MPRPVGPIKDSWPGIVAMAGWGLLFVPYLAGTLASLLVKEPVTLRSAVALALHQCGLSGLAIWHLRANLRLPWSSYGVCWPRWQHIRVGVLAGLLLLAVNSLGVAMGRTLATRLIGSERALELYRYEFSRVMGIFLGECSTLTLVCMSLAVIILVPVAEEIFFRGYLYGALKSKMGLAAIPVASLLFAAAHLYLVQGVAIFLVALGLVVLYERQGSLWPSVVAHATINTLGVIALLAQRNAIS